MVWEGYDFYLGGPNPSGYPGSGEGTFGRRMAVSGQPTGPTFLANTVSDGYQGNYGQLDVAGAASAAFAVVWMSEDGHSDLDGSITLQRFSKAGKKVGAELHVSLDADYGLDPHVASAPDGSMIVAWWDARIRARLTGSDGAPTGRVALSYVGAPLASGPVGQVRFACDFGVVPDSTAFTCDEFYAGHACDLSFTPEYQSPPSERSSRLAPPRRRKR